MKIPNFLKNNIEECEQENFKRNLVFDNIRRGKILAITVVGFELTLIVIDIYSAIMKVDNRFSFDHYFIMYSIMILINITYLLFIKRAESLTNISMLQLKKIEIGIIIYITLMMSWGSIVTLMDQKLYGQLMAFMVNIMFCSVLYFLDHKKILIPYFFSVLILVIGLPAFQSSKDILIGHIVNLCVFVIVSWLASRIIFASYCNDFISKVLLKKSNSLLEKEIEDNREINIKLAMANFQLKELALLDELTGIPNRRSFRNYIDMLFKDYVKGDSVLSIMMIDIDFFKQYNDHYGHEEGDKALIAVANQINSMVRNSLEFFGRWGGEEFIYTIFNAKEEDIAERAEAIRKKVCELEIPHEFSKTYHYISASIGTCTFKIAGKDDVSKGIKLADEALYSAKNSGRNCVKNT